MKTYGLIGVAALVLVACSSDSPKVEPKSTAVGTPIGSPVSKVIGTAGGSLSSTDGNLSLEIPAGALAQDQTVSIQEISNEAHGKVSKAFRLSPEGVQFAKPVQLRFRYTDGDVVGSTAKLLRVAYQDGQGFWHVYKQVTLDSAGKTVSVQAQHFSDWSLISGAQILPHTSSVNVGRTVELKIVQCEQLEESDPSGDGVFVTILASCESSVLTNLGAENWAVSGKTGGSSSMGTIVPDSDRTKGLAVYTAPFAQPRPNPVNVSVDYTAPFETERQTLVASIQVIDPSLACNQFRNVSVWNGTFGVSYDFSGQNTRSTRLTVSHFAEVTARLEKSAESENGVSWVGYLTGMSKVTDQHVEAGDPEIITSLKGASAPFNAPVILNGSRASLNIDLVNCSYNVGLVLFTPSEETVTPGTQRTPGNYFMGSVRGRERFIVDGNNLTESGDFLAHSEDWGLSNDDDAYFVGGLGNSMFDDGFATEGGAGSATVSWSYQPE